MATCSKCGSEVAEGATFCSVCGARLGVKLAALRDRECPSCGLLSPPSAMVCDCGHEFDASADRLREAVPKALGDRQPASRKARIAATAGGVAVLVSYLLPWSNTVDLDRMAIDLHAGAELVHEVVAAGSSALPAYLWFVFAAAVCGPALGAIASLAFLWRKASKRFVVLAALAPLLLWLALVAAALNGTETEWGKTSYGLFVCLGGMVLLAISAMALPGASRERSDVAQVLSARPSRGLTALVVAAGVGLFAVVLSTVWELGDSPAERTAEMAQVGSDEEAADEEAASPEGEPVAGDRGPARFIENQGWVGVVALCDTADQVRRALGDPTSVEDIRIARDKEMWTYLADERPRIAIVMSKGGQRVQRIGYSGPDWESSRGIRAGSIDHDVRRVYGEDNVQESMSGYHVTGSGIAFETDLSRATITDERGLRREGYKLTSIEVALKPLQDCSEFRRAPELDGPNAVPVTVAAGHAEAGAGEQDVTDQLINAVTASSHLVSRSADPEKFSPEKAFDGRADTTWSEGAEGSGIGEWIEARFRRPVRVAALMVTPGFDHVNDGGSDLFTENRFMTSFDLEYDGGHQTYRVPTGTRVFRADLGGVETTRIRIIARGVQAEPARWDDLCISEVRVFERAGGPAQRDGTGAPDVIEEEGDEDRFCPNGICG